MNVTAGGTGQGARGSGGGGSGDGDGPDRSGGSGEPDDGEEPIIITVPAAMQAGVWANWATLNESDHEFTLDLARIDNSVDPNLGVVVARVGMSPKLLRQLCDILGEAWERYMAQVYDDVLPGDGPGADDGDQPDEQEPGELGPSD